VRIDARVFHENEHNTEWKWQTVDICGKIHVCVSNILDEYNIFALERDRGKLFVLKHPLFWVLLNKYMRVLQMCVCVCVCGVCVCICKLGMFVYDGKIIRSNKQRVIKSKEFFFAFFMTSARSTAEEREREREREREERERYTASEQTHKTVHFHFNPFKVSVCVGGVGMDKMKCFLQFLFAFIDAKQTKQC
jgi:hypothetical protein